MRKFIKIILGLTGFLTIVAGIAIFASRNPITAAPDDFYTFKDTETKLAAGANIRLSMMITATTMAPEFAMFEGGSPFKTRKLAHSAVLVCHPQGLLMFDTGLGRDIDKQFEDMPFLAKMLMSYDATAPAIEQLDQTVFCPDRPLRIILSHLHWDHASGIEDFPGTPVWTTDHELASGRLSENSSGYLEAQFDDPQINWHSFEFTDARHMNYDQSLDLFSDGSVILVPMRGHTAGSVGMFVNLGPGQRYYFTGDTTWSVEGFIRPAHKFALMRAMADGDTEQTEAEIRRVNALMRYDPSLQIIPAHDFDAYMPGAIYPDFISAHQGMGN